MYTVYFTGVPRENSVGKVAKTYDTTDQPHLPSFDHDQDGGPYNRPYCGTYLSTILNFYAETLGKRRIQCPDSESRQTRTVTFAPENNS